MRRRLRIKAVMVSRPVRFCEALVTAFASNTKARLNQNVFVYRLTFRWPKFDCDVDNCTSK